MKLETVLERLGEDTPAVFIGETPETYEDAIIGVVLNDDKVVYDYNLLVEAMMAIDGMTFDEAVEWIDYNTLRSLPYMGPNAPIIVDTLDD